MYRNNPPDVHNLDRDYLAARDRTDDATEAYVVAAADLQKAQAALTTLRREPTTNPLDNFNRSASRCLLATGDNTASAVRLQVAQARVRYAERRANIAAAVMRTAGEAELEALNAIHGPAVAFPTTQGEAA